MGRLIDLNRCLAFPSWFEYDGLETLGIQTIVKLCKQTHGKTPP